MDWGWDRETCQRVIADEGLPVPVKSACFFCPASKKSELIQLSHGSPDLYAQSLALEDRYRAGKHYRGEDGSTRGLGRRFSWREHGEEAGLIDEFQLIGQTRDDAAGEAFDKVARILGLGYPGGPAIQQIAAKGKKSQIHFTSAQLPDTLDFSYSGIKTAVLYHKKKHEKEKDFNIANIAHAFQESIVRNLTDKCLAACKKFKSKTLLMGGGVAANMLLRKHLAQTLKKEQRM